MQTSPAPIASGTLGAQSSEEDTALHIAGLYFFATRHGGRESNKARVFPRFLLLQLLEHFVVDFFKKKLDKTKCFVYN